MKYFFSVLLKELTSFSRSYALLFVVLYAFTVDIYIAGSGMEVEAKNVSIGLVDKSAGGISKKIISNLHEPEFQAIKLFKSQKDLSRAIYNKEIMVGLIFDGDFEKNYYAKRNPQINILMDATSASQSLMALGYLQNIIMDFNAIHLPISLKIHKLFNQNAKYKIFYEFK